MPRITNNIPVRAIDSSKFKILEYVSLADNAFNEPQRIDILIGAELFYDLFDREQIKLIDDGPTLKETKFGWIISGPIFNTVFSKKNTSNISLLVSQITETDSLDEKIARFWKLENINGKINFSLEEKACRDHFNRTVRRGDNGKFVVQLSFRDSVAYLGDSYAIALRRFKSIEKKLQSNSEFHKEYTKFMEEYLQLDHMELVQDSNGDLNYEQGYFLPPHAVLNENSSTTRLRVVFDGSCKTRTGTSLNEALLKDPSIQEDLVNILTRFRIYKYAMSVDISKMYRQILVAAQHRKLQKILWRSDPSQPIQIFQLKAVTYDTIPASFLATACLSRLAEDEYNNYPNACSVIKRDFYMDDYLGGANTKKGAIKLQDELRHILQKGGFYLRKWTANDLELLKGLKTGNNDSVLVLELENRLTKVLGLLWCPENDAFQYKIQTIESETRVTSKRDILSQVFSLFDPLGLVGPIVIKAKILMQKLWKLKIDWYMVVPPKLQEEWRNYLNELGYLRELFILRFLNTEENCMVEIHRFADASLAAYGACLYIRVTNNNDFCTSRLICAKSKVAPLKVISLPRFELCATVVLAKLADKI